MYVFLIVSLSIFTAVFSIATFVAFREGEDVDVLWSMLLVLSILSLVFACNLTVV